MSDPDRERDLDAAEAALFGERGASPEWCDRLAPLALGAAPVAPPPNLFNRIEAALDAEGAVVALHAARRRARGWRAAAGGAGALAAGLALWIAATPPPPPAAAGYVAVVTAEGGASSMIVEVDLARGVAQVRPVGVAAPEAAALELWRIPAGSAPISLGLIDPAREQAVAVSAAPGDIFAVSVEPPGGAPGGAPTGPVILSGPLTALP